MILAMIAWACTAAAGDCESRLDFGTEGISHLSWDTEGGGRSAQNLLRAHVVLRIPETPLSSEISRSGAQEAAYALSGVGYDVSWTIQNKDGGFVMHFACNAMPSIAASAGTPAPVELLFPFAPLVTPTTVLPAGWDDQGALCLPAVISAPDYGQMLLCMEDGVKVSGRLIGSRKEKSVDLILALPLHKAGDRCSLSCVPLHLAAPAGLHDSELWQCARRGWFGALQCSAEWGDPGHAYSAPAGMLSNNVISDPASCSLWFYADQAFFTPELAPGVSAMHLVRRTLDWWLDTKILPNGEMICYWDKAHFLDANSGPLIAAWDYVEVTGDRLWLARRIPELERLADYLVQRDVDGDGLVEALQSGNCGTLQQPDRSCAWWDALNCGHKDSYSNALVYRAWRCLSDLELKLGRTGQAAHYSQCAERLKAAYMPALFNEETGWLAWWRSEDGTLHDYASPIINGMAIEYGLVEPALGREILERLRQKMAEAGFTRFDLGVPPMLMPVRREDYLLPDAVGLPSREDGTDTFGHYMNGGITAGQVLHFLAAHYVVGEGAEADRILRAMLERQAKGGFQNGTVNAYPEGIDWTTWDGKPAGYEGYLADSFRFLQAVLLREPVFRMRLYRPMEP